MPKPVQRLILGLGICVAGWLAIATGQEPMPPQLSYVADEVLIRFRPQSSATRRDAIVRAAGARVLRRMERLNTHRARLAAGTSVNAAIAALRTNADVLSAEPNFIRRIVAGSNDPHWIDGSLWGLKKIGAEAAWNFTTGSSSVVVADIDTGVNYNHPDLHANMWRNPGEVPGNGLDDDQNGYLDDVFGIDTANNDSDPMDDHGHGTHTAGTIGGVGNNGAGVVGVNWNVRILPCKFLKADGSGNDGDAIECFNYLIALKNKGVDIRVTSNSWGSARDISRPVPQALKNAIDAAGNAGILSVFAAGNTGGNNDVAPFDPASFDSPGIVSVAASDAADQRAGFSNYGVTSVDLAAPGVSILSTHGTGYGQMSGTSMAAPHVAGAAALLSGFNQALTATGIKSVLMDSVDRLAPWSGVVASGGRLNLLSSVVAANGDSPPSVTITKPATGSTFTAPASITIEASASDVDGVVTKVEFYANGALIGTDTTSPYGVDWSSVQAGYYNLSAVATDNRSFTGTSDTIGVTVSPLNTADRVNVASAANGATASASSTYSSAYAADGVINGDRKGLLWGGGGGWNEAAPGVYPDWLRIDFSGAKTIDEVDVFSVQDSYGAPGTPTPSMTFTNYGLTDFRVEYLNGTQWVPVPGASVTGNRLVWRQFTFTPITTSAVRLFITGAGDGWARATEVEAYSGGTVTPPPPPPPTARLNVALAANGATATASSTYNSGYAASGVINGERNGIGWGNGGGWNEAAPGTYPDWLRIDFAGAKTIDEVDVFSVQDSYGAPATPTPTMIFTNYGLTDFRVEYLNGTQWVPVPGASVTGNRLVWRQFTFGPVTTAAVRVLITGTTDGWARATEVEAYSGGTVTPPPPPPPPSPPIARVNVALAANGATATASSTYSNAYAASGVINGDRNGMSWGNGGGWSEITPASFPEWIQISFNGNKTIDEIDVFSVQDSYGAPSAPTATMTFSLYGLTAFELQYWTGSQWAAIPGASITGNRQVWRQFTFTPLTTSAIRVFITGGMDGWARATEVEAYASSGTSQTSLIGFPSDNWWNRDISSAPVDPASSSYISFINNGSVRRLHPDFGGKASPDSVSIYGMPYVVVDGTVPKKAVQFYYSSESDGVDHTTDQSFPFYPIPDAAITQPYMLEGGEPGNIDRRAFNDRHLLIVDRDKRHLYELWNVYHDGTQWHAGSGAFFDMNTNDRRQEGWTSADAAGLAILSGLVRYDEAFGSQEITHAFRVTVRATNGYVFPASHRAGSTIGALPMGARLRLKSTTNIAGFTPELQRIFRAMMRYGLIVADNGTDMFVSGAFDERWNNDVLNPAFRSLTASDFEVIATGYR